MASFADRRLDGSLQARHPRRAVTRQLDLFDPGARGSQPPSRPPRRRTTAIGPAPVPDEVRATAEALPASIRLGTSSWSFPGWAGIVYDQVAGTQRLAREGLRAYAAHPLLGAVGVDRTYYRPVEAADLARYAEVVPDGFRFLVKAHEHCTTARFPDHPRHGARAGTENDRFLDPAYASDRVVGPAVEGLGDALGTILFQFPPQRTRIAGEPAAFASRLHAFLAALPAGPRYAVEIRNPEWLTAGYADALADVGAVHCATVHPTMPGVAEQLRRTTATRGHGLVVRWMLGGDRTYEDARDRYAPFDRLVDEDRSSRREIASACLAAHRAGEEALVIVNNKAEGSSPLSVVRLAEQVVERLGT